MKKILLIGVPTLLLLAIVYFYVAVPTILPTWFATRHILIYMLFTYFTVLVAYVIYNYLLRKTETKAPSIWTVRAMVFVSTVLVLFGGSQLQLYLIDAYEVPPVLGCVYYDKYNNLIYSSQYLGTCPDITIDYEISHDDAFYYQSMKAEIIETITGNDSVISFDKQLNTVIVAVYEPIPKTVDINSISQRLFQTVETTITEHSILQDMDSKDYETVISYTIQEVQNTMSGDYSESPDLLTSQTELTQYQFDITLSGRHSLNKIVLPEQSEMDIIRHQILSTTLTKNHEYGYCTQEHIGSCNYYDILIEAQIEGEDDDVVYAEGYRDNTYQELQFFLPENPYQRQFYKTTYWGSRWSGQTEEYSTRSIYPNTDVIGYHYDDITDPYKGTMFKQYYSNNTDSTNEDISVLHFIQQDTNFFIDEDRHIEQVETAYGFQLIYYSTLRDGAGRYTIYPTSGERSYHDFYKSTFIPTTMVFDGKAMLEDVDTYKPLYIVLQYNILIYGVSTPILVFT